MIWNIIATLVLFDNLITAAYMSACVIDVSLVATPMGNRVVAFIKAALISIDAKSDLLLTADVSGFVEGGPLTAALKVQHVHPIGAAPLCAGIVHLHIVAASFSAILIHLPIAAPLRQEAVDLFIITASFSVLVIQLAVAASLCDWVLVLVATAVSFRNDPIPTALLVPQVVRVCVVTAPFFIILYYRPAAAAVGSRVEASFTTAIISIDAISDLIRTADVSGLVEDFVLAAALGVKVKHNPCTAALCDVAVHHTIAASLGVSVKNHPLAAVMSVCVVDSSIAAVLGVPVVRFVLTAGSLGNSLVITTLFILQIVGFLLITTTFFFFVNHSPVTALLGGGVVPLVSTTLISIDTISDLVVTALVNHKAVHSFVATALFMGIEHCELKTTVLLIWVIRDPIATCPLVNNFTRTALLCGPVVHRPIAAAFSIGVKHSAITTTLCGLVVGNIVTTFAQINNLPIAALFA